MASVLVRDKDLTTESEIIGRMDSIKRQRDVLCAPRERPEHHLMFDRRQSKIAKLTEREDALRIRLRDLRRAS